MSTATSPPDSTKAVIIVDASGNWLSTVTVSLGTLISGEDQANNVMKMVPFCHTGSAYPAGSFVPFGQGAGDLSMPVNIFSGFSGGGRTSLFSDLTATKRSMASSGGNLYHLHIENTTGATAYVQLFDALSASVTVGTTVPNWEFIVPTATDKQIFFGPQGAALVNGLTGASTTTSRSSSASASGVHVTYVVTANA